MRLDLDVMSLSVAGLEIEQSLAFDRPDVLDFVPWDPFSLLQHPHLGC